MPVSVARRREASRQSLLQLGSILILLSLLLLGMVRLAPPAAAAVFDPKTFTLANGMEVVVIENRRVPIVSHMVWYRVGSADEVPGKSGIAHFLEHLMFRGTETLAPGEFSRTVARNGGQENAFTSFDYTGYFQNVAADRLETVMRLEADRMTNLVLTDAVVNPERDVILEERRSRTENRPGGLLREQAGAAMFANHPYGRPIIGWKHEIQALGTQDALAFYRRYYAPNNAILIVAGDVSVDQVRTLAERYYGPIPAQDIPERVRPQEPPQHAPRRVVLRDERVGQPRFSRRYLAPSYNRGATEHAYALQLLAEILGGGSTSRLYRSLVVERQLAAGAGAWYNPNTFDLGGIGVFATPRPGVDIAQVETAVDAELQEILEAGVTADELARAKDRMEAGAIYARDDLSTGARVFGVALTTGRTVEEVEAWPERIAAVTAAQVQAAARAVFVRQNSVTSLLLPKTQDKTE